MNLRQLIKYALWRDTTFKGEFKAMERLAGPDCPKIIIDVGANDGFYGSNSFPFVARGWRGILVEPHPVAFEALRKLHAKRANATLLNIACGAAPGQLPLWSRPEGISCSTFDPDKHPHFAGGKDRESRLVEIRPLAAVLAEQKLPHDLGILSIDTEGWDLEVLRGLELQTWRPRLIVTEDSRRGDQEEKAEFLRKHGYAFREQILVNAFWTAS